MHVCKARPEDNSVQQHQGSGLSGASPDHQMTRLPLDSEREPFVRIFASFLQSDQDFFARMNQVGMYKGSFHVYIKV